jgi:tRNA/tmRNA/rRNA uracil-C5-methylase (TrmA/RlmC/RlmD family)
VDGRVVFVRHALPGETVIALVTEDKGGSFCRADAIEVLTPSPHRVTPPCSLAAPGGCGGCDWQHATGAYQRELKASVVAEQLHRLAGLDITQSDVDVEELPGGLLEWRTRARLAVDDDGRPGFRAHHSHRVVPVETCPIAAPGTVDEVTERHWRPGTELEVCVDSDQWTHVTQWRKDRRGKGIPRPVVGEPVAVERAARRDWRVSAHGFWQVHPDAADALSEVVSAFSGLSAGQCGWDLYSGVGLFAGVLAAQVGTDGAVIAVESMHEAAEFGVDNLLDLPQVRTIAGRVEAVLGAADLPDPDAVVLDPPRKGAGREVVNAIADRLPARVVYVACDPAALARDVKSFAERGFRLAELRAFDAFPMTHHVECVALLERT